MKHTIEIEGLPEGWEPVAFRVPSKGESIIDFNGDLVRVRNKYAQPRLILKKKQPRRIVLEEVNTVEYDLLIDNVTYNIVEDIGENDD